MIELDIKENISIITIKNGKVNALDHKMLLDIELALKDIEESHHKTNTILISGNGSFFSFGLDIPSFLELSRDELKLSINKLLHICDQLFRSSKVTISSLNGHATGAGCMIAISSDFRLMVNERAKIALNEINIGLPLFSSTILMLRNSIGYNNAKKVLLTGDLLSPQEALNLGLVDSLHDKEDLYQRSLELALSFKSKDSSIIKIMKNQLNAGLETYVPFDLKSSNEIEEFLDIFYLEETQNILRKIVVRK
jgi:3,2-trans-enoyl-CoA isomerase